MVNNAAGRVTGDAGFKLIAKPPPFGVLLPPKAKLPAAFQVLSNKIIRFRPDV